MRRPGLQRSGRKPALVCGAVIAFAPVWLHASRSDAAEGGSSCPLSLGEQIESVHKFAPIASFVTKEPRCFNCHGGVNPHIDGVGADPEDANAPVSTVTHGGGAQERGENGLMATGCDDCHENMVPKRDGTASRWFTAPPVFTFVGKSAPELCKQFKRSTETAEHFLGHLEDDNGGNNFSKTAFAGNRGLNEEWYAKGSPPAPPSITHGTFKRLGEDWVNAMGGAFAGDENCGCEVRLKGKFTSTDTGELGPMRDVIKVTGDLVWKKIEDDGAAATAADAEPMSFTPVSGEITVEMEFENRGLEGMSVCKGSGRKAFPVGSIAQGALRLMKLEISDDGSYQVMLVIPDMPDPFPAWSFDSTCTFPNVAHTQPVEVRHISVTLGKQQGVVDDERGIVGQLSAPIRRGPRTITGSWSFDTQGTP
jgi:hypothetical protein